MSQRPADVLRVTPYQTIADEFGEEIRLQATYGIQNGHFTVTGEGWYKKPSGRYPSEPDVAGQVTDLRRAFPWLRTIMNMHLADAVTGEPLYAVENSLFWLRSLVTDYEYCPDGWKDFNGRQRAASYLDCPVGLIPKGDLAKEEQRAALEEVVRELAPAWAARAYATRVLYNLGDHDTAPAEQIAEQVLDAHYGDGSDWAEENHFGERGFTRAQAESDIGRSDIAALITEAVAIDRAENHRSPSTKEN